MSGNMNQPAQQSSKRPYSPRDADNNPKRSKLNNQEGVSEGTNTHGTGRLRNLLSGIIYQLKIQMLILKQALDKGYEFQLGTEVKDAVDFDDIVFRYKSVDEKLCFVQAKHSRIKSKTITTDNLLADKKNDFSLQKYFMSYRKINKNREYRKVELKKFILYTNMDFKSDDLKKSSIEMEDVPISDDIFKITEHEVYWKRIKSGNVKLHEKLREASDLYLLANYIKPHIFNEKKKLINSDVFQLYRGILSEKVFDIVSYDKDPKIIETEQSNENKKTSRKCIKFRADFLDGDNTLSEDVKKFRDVLKSVLKMENDDSAFQSLLDGKEIDVALNFDEVLNMQNNPKIVSPKELAEKIFKIFSDAEEKIVSIKNLAGYILEQTGEQNSKDSDRIISFSQLFSKDEGSKLPNNLKEFKKEFEAIVRDKVDFDKFKGLGFKITSNGALLLPQTALPNDEIEESEIKDFFDELFFAVSQPDDDKLGDIIKTKLGESSQFNLLDAEIVLASFQSEMLKWFKGEVGKWHNRESGENLFKKIEKQVKDLISVGLNAAYAEELLGYGVRFKRNNISQKFLGFITSNDDPKNILLITAQETTVFNAIKVCQALEEMKKSEAFSKYRNSIFMSLNKLLRPNMQKRVIDDLKSTDSYYFIIIDCESAATKELIDNLHTKLLQTNKKIILIAKENDALASRFLVEEKKECKTKEKIDKTTFGDLDLDSQKRLLDVKISLIGEDIELKHLYFKLNDSKREPSDEDLNERDFDIEPLAPLLSNTKVEVGYKPPGMSDLEGAYSDLHEQINVKTFVDKLSSKDLSDIYIISGISDSNKVQGLINYLGNSINKLEYLGNSISKLEYIKSQITIFNKDKTSIIERRIQLADDQFDKYDFQRSGFERVCRNNSKRKIYWIHLQNDETKLAFLEKVYDPYFYVLCDRFTSEVILEQGIKDLFVSDKLSRKCIISVENRNAFETWLGIKKDEEDEKKQFNKNCDDQNIVFISPEHIKKYLQPEGTQKTYDLLELKQKKLVLLEPADSINHLVKYRAKGCERVLKPFMTEGGLIQEIRNKKVVIIAGDPGIGKSTTLVYLYELEHDDESKSEQKVSMLKLHWVIKINLKDHVALKTIRNIDFHDTSDESKIIIEFLSQIGKNLESGIAKNLLEAAFKNKDFNRPLLLAFDGFDEVLDERDRKKIVSLLKILKKNNIRLWVSTRLHYEEDLEDALSTFATQLGSMNEKTIHEFIAKSFGNRLNLLLDQEKFRKIFGDSYEVLNQYTDPVSKYSASDAIQKYADSFVNNMKKLLNNDVSKFIGTPLLLYLLLKNSETLEHFKVYDVNHEPHFGYLGDNIWQVYETFVDSVYNTYLEKKDFENLWQDQNKKTFDDYHMDLAKSFILETETKKDLGKFKDIILISGIVKSDGRNIDFIHPTFRDYFATKVFLKWIWEESNELSNPREKEYFLKEILMKMDHQFIRVLINTKLEGTTETLRETSLKAFKDSVSTLWEVKPNPLIDGNGETILHIASGEKKTAIIKFLLKIIDNNVMEKLMVVRNNSHRTVLYVAMKKIPDCMKDLLKRVEFYGKSTQEKIILATIFTSKADRKKFVINSLIGLLRKPGICDQLKATYENLQLTFDEYHVNLKICCNKYEIIKKFLHAKSVEQIKNILETQRNENVKYFLFKSVTKKGNNILHKAGRAGSSTLVKFLLDHYKEYFNVNGKCKKKRTALHKAARAGSLNSVKCLVDNGAETDIKDNWNNIPLRDAVRSGKLEVVEYFFERDPTENKLLYADRFERTALDDAALLGHVGIVNWMLDKVDFSLTALESAKELASTTYSKLIAKPNETHEGSSTMEDDTDQDKLDQELRADDKTNAENVKEIIEVLEQKIREKKFTTLR